MPWLGGLGARIRMQQVRSRFAWIAAICWTALVLTSCRATRDATTHFEFGSMDCIKPTLQSEDADVSPVSYEQVAGPGKPRSINDQANMKYRDLTLQEAIQLTLTHSKVMRDLGGAVIRLPESVRTSYDPATQESDPQFGVEGALSAFDANFATSLFFEKNDRRYNNQMLGDAGIFVQDYDVSKTEFSKRAATGSQFALRNIIAFDSNNSLGVGDQINSTICAQIA